MLRVVLHLIVAVLAGTTLHAQAVQTSDSAPVVFNISVRGQRIGQEAVQLARTSDGWLITSTGGQAGLTPFTINKFEAAYSSDWSPRSLVADAQSAGALLEIKTTFAGTTATNDILQGGQTGKTTQTVSERTVVLPNNFFGAYEALAARLHTSAIGAAIPIYVAPQAEITGTVTAITPQRIQTPDAIVELRHFTMSMQNPNGAIIVDISIDARGRLAKVGVPGAGISVLRSDLSNVMTRDITYQNASDKQVYIPSLGFTIAATTTAPASVKTGERLPAVILISGSQATDRDEAVAGVPLFAQLAKSLSTDGYLVVRYDKRGIGQSGGRAESVTLQDYAEDVLNIVAWLRDRADIDPKRIALVGHDEGAAVALYAGDRAGGKVAAVALLASTGTTGRETVLEQQRRLLERSGDTEEQKREKIRVQTQIVDAVVKGSGWDGVPPALQKATDTLMFKSWVEYDPAKVMKKVDQPVLIAHGALDTEVLPVNADRLEALAKARKGTAGTLSKKVIVPNVNHLMVPAASGEMSEYASLPDKTVSPAVAAALNDWLRIVMTKK